MDKFNDFFASILRNSNIPLGRELNIEEVRFIISKINEFFYTNYDGIGETEALGESFEYFSEFHKFWEQNHKEILNPKVDEIKCEQLADVLHQIYLSHGSGVFYELYDTHNLSPEVICRIRYFSANQDFRGSRDFSDVFAKYSNDPSIFDAQNIYENPEVFLKNIGITKLSQGDKRVKYAKTAAKLLIENEIDAIDLINKCNNDIFLVRELLLSNRGSGFGNKKTDMFLRDMVVLGVWGNVGGFDKLDVASDINTVKVALRTGILKTDIVLISSFLDIFCYQYAMIDKINALAWRRVWEIWNEKYPNETIESPSLIDYLVYRIIGKEFCKESLCYFKCVDEGHEFPWHSSLNKTCQVCNNARHFRKKAKLIKRILPCMSSDGHVAFEQNEFTSGQNAPLANVRVCPFVTLCNPTDSNFKKLNPPKSISILGMTGWDGARTRLGEGGGGLMS